MAGLVDECLGLTEASARQQWRHIASRVWRDRQERFLPVELVLCFALFRVLNPHRYGGGNMHRLPPAVTAFARAVKRPPGSLTNKMLNLEGFRANGARDETLLFLQLGQRPESFAALYVTVLRAARLEVFGEAEVPDFLGWLMTAPDLPLAGQDEIGTREVDLALADNGRDLEALEKVYGFDARETSRLVEQRVRLGQHCFAIRVLEQYERHCAFCGLDARSLPGHRLLVASHIKPWAASDNRERLDPRNGVSACSLHDSAFDTGLLTVADDLTIERASALKGLIGTDTVMARFFGADAISPSLRVPHDGGRPGSRYLEYHQREVFRG